MTQFRPCLSCLNPWLSLLTGLPVFSLTSLSQPLPCPETFLWLPSAYRNKDRLLHLKFKASLDLSPSFLEPHYQSRLNAGPQMHTALSLSLFCWGKPPLLHLQEPLKDRPNTVTFLKPSFSSTHSPSPAPPPPRARSHPSLPILLCGLSPLACCLCGAHPIFLLVCSQCLSHLCVLGAWHGPGPCLCSLVPVERVILSAQ